MFLAWAEAGTINNKENPMKLRKRSGEVIEQPEEGATTLGQLSAGQCFRFPSTSPHVIYMKVYVPNSEYIDTRCRYVSLIGGGLYNKDYLEEVIPVDAFIFEEDV